MQSEAALNTLAHAIKYTKHTMLHTNIDITRPQAHRYTLATSRVQPASWRQLAHSNAMLTGLGVHVQSRHNLVLSRLVPLIHEGPKVCIPLITADIFVCDL